MQEVDTVLTSLLPTKSKILYTLVIVSTFWLVDFSSTNLSLGYFRMISPEINSEIETYLHNKPKLSQANNDTILKLSRNLLIIKFFTSLFLGYLSACLIELLSRRNDATNAI